MRRRLGALLVALTACATAPRTSPHAALPAGFVYLSDVAPTVLQDIRYAGSHNFVGRPVTGYVAPACILTKPAAQALAKAQAELFAAGLTFRVYDCYRPQRAVDALVAWSKNEADQRMKAEYYPRVDKSRFVALGYVNAASGHARGSSVDLTIARLAAPSPAPWVAGKHSCIAPFLSRYHDGSIDMGTNYDCLDPLSLRGAAVGGVAGSHRAMLRDVMERYGFAPAGTQWWEFRLRSEPFPKTAFDFPITPK